MSQTQVTTTRGTGSVVVELQATECRWQYASGRLVDGYSYNGRIPGSVIEARVGQLLAVRLDNQLPEPTTIHWHGLRIPAAMDGTELVQRPVPPSGTFDYAFLLCDGEHVVVEHDRHECGVSSRARRGRGSSTVPDWRAARSLTRTRTGRRPKSSPASNADARGVRAAFRFGDGGRGAASRLSLAAMATRVADQILFGAPTGARGVRAL